MPAISGGEKRNLLFAKPNGRKVWNVYVYIWLDEDIYGGFL